MSPEGASGASVVGTVAVLIFNLLVYKQYASSGKQLDGLTRRFFSLKV